MYLTRVKVLLCAAFWCQVAILLLASADPASGQSLHQRTVYNQQLAEQRSLIVANDDSTLDNTKLSIWAVKPGIVKWPVVLAGIYTDTSVSSASLIYEWTFPGIDDQSCTVSGRTSVLPCRGMAVEKTFLYNSSPSGFNVTLTVYIPGGSSVMTSTQVVVAQSFSGPTVVRKDYRTLTKSDWDKMVYGMLELKRMGVWDHMAYIHQVASFTETRPGTTRNAAHNGPALLPWHRAFVRHMERTMQAVLKDPTFGIPYWDWSEDVAMRQQFTSPLWTNSYLGPSGDPGRNYAVTSGFFCGIPSATCYGNWTLPLSLDGPVLIRAMGVVVASLPSPPQVTNVLSVASYDIDPYDASAPPPNSFRMALEGAGGTMYGLFHNGVHSWVGGAMGTMASPSDPAFFLHHSFIEKLFFRWQKQNNCQTSCFRPMDNDGTVRSTTPGAQLINGVWKIQGHHWGDALYPWSIAIRDVYPIPGNVLNGYQYDSA